MTFHYRYRKQIIIVSSFILIAVIISIFTIHNYLSSNKTTTPKNTVVIKRKKEPVKKEIEDLQVDIKGEVNTPGIYKLKNNSRVIDVINMAGGLTENANTTVINLSKKITDEMVIIIYSNREVKDFAKTKQTESQVIDYCNQKDENSLHNDACISKDTNKSSNPGKISINNATKEELMTLPGIGESKAKNIIEYRKSNGMFNTIEDITKVSGIGDSLFAQIKEYITT